VPLYSVLGLIHGQRGEWQLALSNYAKTLRFMPSDEEARRQFLPTAYHALAPLLVQTGDLAGYRAHCQAILREFGATTDPVTAERMAKDCMMLPPAAADLPTLAKMADTAVAAGPGHKDWAYFQFVKGLAEYRRGNFTNAVEWLTKVVAQPADPKRTVQAYMTLAMARHELGRLEEARATLAQGLELSKEKLYQPVKGNADGVWNDWIIAQTLTREAVGLIGVEPRKGTAQ
jgi:tetratricopeptide (TPR) repeat protein